MSYATVENLRGRLGKVINDSSVVDEERAEELLAEASAEIDVLLIEHGWHTLPLDLTPDVAAPAKALLRAATVEAAALRFLQATYARANTGAEQDSATGERDRLFDLLTRPLPGLPRREPLDSMAHLYDLAAAPAAVVTECNRRLRAYQEQRPRVAASTALEATGVGAMLRPFLLATPVEL